jgi:tRNA pseudouridine55 synthase
LDGILNINKPLAQTSFSIVAMVKHRSGERRVGHAGTLDPAASGVLPICLGRATRVVEFLMDTTKNYLAGIELGTTTDTYDSEGQVTQTGDISGIDMPKLESALDAFRGAIRQTPPMYSAVKHRGQPLYKLARAGISVERQSRPAIIHSLKLISWEPPLATIEVECGKGTYIRSLAHDLGQNMGCGAYLKSLVRTRCGIFDIKDSVSVPQLEEAFRYGYWQNFVYPIDAVLQHYRAVVISDSGEDNIRNGKTLTLSDISEQPATDSASAPDRCRAYTADGRFLGVLHRLHEKDLWQPEKVF